MTASSRVVRHNDDTRVFVTRQIAGETLIVPVTGSMANLESIYVLNDVGSRIWELLGTPTDAISIASTLAGEFAVSPERATEDVREFLDSLTARGLIRNLAESAS